MVTWIYKEYIDSIEFTMTMVTMNPYTKRWVAIGFSDDELMASLSYSPLHFHSPIVYCNSKKMLI